MDPFIESLSRELRLLQEHLPSLPLSNPVVVFALLMAVILLAPRLAARAGIPGMIGLILAGVALGPNALKLLERGDTMQLFGAVGMIYIMFVAGLELDLQLFDRYKSHALVLGTLTFVLPMAIGTGLNIALWQMGLGTAILLGCMFASYTLVTFPIVQRFGIVQNRAVVASIGAMMVADVTALVVLSIITGSAQGGFSAAVLLRVGVGLAALVAIVTLLLPRLGRRFFRTVSGEGASEFLFVLSAIFTCAVLAEVLGIEPIVGAFLGGLALNRLVPHTGALMNRIQFTGNALFIPMFLVATGMLVDLRVLWGEPRSVLIMIYISAATLATKWLAARLAQAWLGYTPAEGSLLFGLTVPHVASTLAVAVVGMRAGLFDEMILNGAVLMIFATCVLGTWITERAGRRVAAEEDHVVAAAEAPQRLMVPLARSDSAAPLLDLAFHLRPPRSTEPVHVATVVTEGPDAAQRVAESEKALSLAVMHAASAEVPVNPVTRIDLNIASGILRAMRELRISQVVIGWPGVVTTSQRIFGSVLDQLLAQSSEMVLVCRMTHPVNAVSRLVLVLPPLAERETGFEPARRLLRLLASRIGASELVAATLPTLERLKRRADDGGLGKASTLTLAEWDNLAGELQSVITRDDLLVMLSAREGRLSWNNELPELPRRLAAMFPETNFVVLYPAEASATPLHLPIAGTELLEARHILLGLDGTSGTEAVRRLVDLAVGGQAAPDLQRQVAEVAEKSTDLAPGIVLIHAHVAEVVAPRLCVGISPVGTAFTGVRRPGQVILLLLSPLHGPPEQHIRALTRIAKMVHRPGVVGQLCAAASATEAFEILHRGPDSEPPPRHDAELMS